MCGVFFFNDTATTEIYTFSLHDALPICVIEKVSKKEIHEKRETSKKKTNDYQEQKRLKSLKNKLGSLEKKIATLESEIAEMDHKLLMEYDQTVANPSFFDAYHGKKKTLDELMESWESLSEELEN